jgi:hypothetical protein
MPCVFRRPQYNRLPAEQYQKQPKAAVQLYYLTKRLQLVKVNILLVIK